MKRLLILIFITCLILSILPLAGCSKSTSIADILANPLQFEGKQVNIKGTVGDTFWLAAVSKGAYQLGDGSATIWIIASQPPPQKGLTAATQGTVTTGFKLGDRTLGTVVTETKRE
jgi:hypothetical protein